MAKKEDLSPGNYVLLVGMEPRNPELKKHSVYGRIISLWPNDLTVVLPEEYGLGRTMRVIYGSVDGPIPNDQVSLGVRMVTNGPVNLPELGIVQ